MRPDELRRLGHDIPDHRLGPAARCDARKQARALAVHRLLKRIRDRKPSHPAALPTAATTPLNGQSARHQPQQQEAQDLRQIRHRSHAPSACKSVTVSDAARAIVRRTSPPIWTASFLAELPHKWSQLWPIRAGSSRSCFPPCGCIAASRRSAYLGRSVRAIANMSCARGRLAAC